ncbi:proline--tRNA ligase [Mycoplasma mycoides subsp. mycoides]|uniref:Proline--tRNA ligase n=1 Tax=Mycoplasma mycoides subsp. mycoides TaxID=2103 RepID=A0AAE2EHF6_MYCMY|nr:proline--tRNA ligase [Mycoplasma mycoides]ADK69138.1 proline--tRNA ligase [Mycoplasma mycoides subsp. mycoides SC str. Gladysdale]AIZ55182.1 Proline--tRNA ligase [Mycoplasma mycoides subsp. mycoides]AME10531.1 proline--tRNA ligase [Mycoplasma mycoides subsp. mycoides]AME11538.1 proline--tRNA ligase [Mycoplasma mycoides subsp. mycoides]AME12563.1 proline--tRNA ligase [Mycoplasma mycoides subsp. mycoides]
MKKQLDKITPRNIDFSQWYTDIVLNTKLASYGPVKGTMIFRPYGYRIWELIQKYLDEEFKKVNVDNVYFPLLIPESLFNKEKDHIEGFSPEIATVTRVGQKKLEENLFIRPTSEVVMMDYFSNEINSYRDLPLIYNQWCNVMRWEKTTRPFLRTSEFLWQEGHTVHSSYNEAENFCLKILNIYEKFAKEILLLPVICGKKTEKEKFAGAKDTYTIESLMFDGQALQCGTSHFFADNFTKVYDIKFQNKENKLEHAYSTSWGVSTRLIGALIMTHSDDNGLVLPSKISPIQIQIIQIKNTEQIDQVVENIKDKLSDYRIDVDNSDKSFGFKISEAEIKGIPIRIEIGPRDLENNQITISRRDQQENKIKIDYKDVKKVVDQMIKDYDLSLYNSALENRKNRTFKANTIEEYIEILKQNQGFVLVPFCGRVECEQDIKTKTATNSRCIPFDQKEVKAKCFNCKKDTCLQVIFARAY